MKTFHFYFLSIIFCLLGCDVFEKDPKEMTITELAAKLRDLPPVKSAEWYANNRNKTQLLDEVFRDSILPFFKAYDFIEIRDASKYLDNTPLSDSYKQILLQSRSQLLFEIYEDIDDLRDSVTNIFLDQVCPLVELQIDSLISEDFSKIMNDFSGGIFNYRKLKFFLGDREKKFTKLWTKHINPEAYGEILDMYGNDFIQRVQVCQEDFLVSYHYLDLTPPRVPHYRFAVDTVPITTPANSILRRITDYVSKERSGMAVSAIKDWVIPSVLSGGYATLYNIGNLAYDAATVIGEIESQQPTNDEVITYLCMDDFYDILSSTYLTSFQTFILNHIDDSFENIYLQIEKSL